MSVNDKQLDVDLITDLIDADFVRAMHECLEAGARKQNRTANDWRNQNADTAMYRHRDKIKRHLDNYQMPTSDQDERRRHAAAIACNAMILWYFS